VHKWNNPLISILRKLFASSGVLSEGDNLVDAVRNNRKAKRSASQSARPDEAHVDFITSIWSIPPNTSYETVNSIVTANSIVTVIITFSVTDGIGIASGDGGAKERHCQKSACLDAQIERRWWDSLIMVPTHSVPIELPEVA
jgi:hypothetical protein